MTSIVVLANGLQEHMDGGVQLLQGDGREVGDLGRITRGSRGGILCVWGGGKDRVTEWSRDRELGRKTAQVVSRRPSTRFHCNTEPRTT